MECNDPYYGDWQDGAAYHFMHDLAGRLSNRVQLTTDGRGKEPGTGTVNLIAELLPAPGKLFNPISRLCLRAAEKRHAGSRNFPEPTLRPGRCSPAPIRGTKQAASLPVNPSEVVHRHH